MAYHLSLTAARASRSFRALLAGALVPAAALCPTVAYAHSGAAEDAAFCHAVAEAQIVQPASEASISVTFPEEGSTINSRDFTLLYVTAGDTDSARLDHVHYQLGEQDNLTTPDLSGVVDVHAMRDGDFDLIVYMATPEHLPINGKLHVHFRILTKGVLLLAPDAGGVVRSNDVLMNYNSYGDLPPGTIPRLSIDGAPEVEDADADGSLEVKALRDGEHSVAVRMMDPDGAQVGDTVTRSFTIASTLSRANAKKALKSAVPLDQEISSTKRSQKIRSVRSTLAAMARGGSKNPADAQLTLRNVNKALGLLKLVEKKTQLTKNLESLRSLLKKMSS